jgi:methyl coenzyme M reductase alpha subunit
MQPTAARSPSLNFLHARTGLGHAPDDFVSRHAGISRAIPFVARLMHIGVADAAIKDLDFDLIRAGVAVLKRERRERRGGVDGGVSFGVSHKIIQLRR